MAESDVAGVRMFGFDMKWVGVFVGERGAGGFTNVGK